MERRRKPLGELLRFPSSKSGEELTSLSEYAGRMKGGQKDIYYIAADSLAAAANAPFVEQLIKRDLEARCARSRARARPCLCMPNRTEAGMQCKGSAERPRMRAWQHVAWGVARSLPMQEGNAPMPIWIGSRSQLTRRCCT